MSKIEIDETAYCQRKEYIDGILRSAKEWVAYGRLTKAIDVLTKGLQKVRDEH